MGPICEDERWLSQGLFIQHLKEIDEVSQACEPEAPESEHVGAWQGSNASLKLLMLISHYGTCHVNAGQLLLICCCAQMSSPSLL
ncbi:hypothetical protein MVEN_01388100 [Mycena venus]|uniref:Uncharacterized protein n=1 Tax=Mycena venus TaxID=2733690 RepID=A0A8H6XV25_9AGAR|nr:hypothetical protein MVEN_01388100 [Mycena venus]